LLLHLSLSHNIYYQKKKENLKIKKELVKKFEKKYIEDTKREFNRKELLEKYMTKLLYK